MTMTTADGVPNTKNIAKSEENVSWLQNSDLAVLSKLDRRIVLMVMWVYLMNMMNQVNIGNACLFGLEISHCRIVRSNTNRSRCPHICGQFCSSRRLSSLLSLFEAGFPPGVVSYLSMFYSRRSLALRIASFSGTVAASGVADGLVGYGISFMDGDHGFILPNFNLVRIHESQVGSARNLREVEWPDVKDDLKDWSTWVYCFSLFRMLTMLYSFVMTMPVYAVGAIIYITWARLSDLTKCRGYFIIGSIVSSVAGYGMLMAEKGPAVSHAGTFFVSTGIFVSACISLARAISTGLHLNY
ncbi:hypothetical protein LX36DRAFT_692694 [Colletotrichum falcatum]|nr:hypothetical protein LX36DRAFT_692694 [Colletotrichum falcatum]